MILAQKVSTHQHLTPRSSNLAEEDRVSFRTANSRMPSATREAPTPPPKELPTPPALRTKKSKPKLHTVPGEWTWRPTVPRRTSSMSTRRRDGGDRRPDLVTFHRRSCQLFSSLDSTLSNATTTSTRTSTSTSPSLTSSVTTQATSILDDTFTTHSFSSFHIDIHDPSVLRSRVPDPIPRLHARRSSSQLHPKITSTEQLFWTADDRRRAEYVKIDAAHTGLKGLMKKILPKSWSWAHGKRRRLYEQDFESDNDSVHRFRISTEHPHIIAGDDDRLNLETGHVGKRQPKQPMKKVLAKVKSSDALSKMFKKNDSTEGVRSTSGEFLR